MSKNIFVLILIAAVFAGCSIKTENGNVVYSSQIIQKSETVTKETPKSTENSSSVFVTNEEKAPLQEEEPQSEISKSNYISIVYPSAEINRYALEATNTINGYLLQVHSEKNFHLKTLDIMRQSKQSIKNAFDAISQEGITKVILMITKEYIDVLKEIDNIEQFTIVLPLINKQELGFNKEFNYPNILFAGVSYQDQFKKLSSYVNGYPLNEFYDNSAIGETLHTFLSSEPVKYSKQINDNNGRYKKVVSSLRSRLNGSALILNTPIVKSSMLLSALTAEEVRPRVVLSTQLNFTPLVFSLTQRGDRNSLIIASSIGQIPDMLEGYSELLGNNILYNWVNYSSMIAIEYLKSEDISIFKDITIENGQVIYPVKLYKVQRSSFSLLPF